MRLYQNYERSIFEAVGFGDVVHYGVVLGESHSEPVKEEDRSLRFGSVAVGSFPI